MADSAMLSAMNRKRFLRRLANSSIFLRVISRPDLIRTIQWYLNSLSSETVRRGTDYLTRGHVLELECIQPGRVYVATVKGGEDYDVELELSGNNWVTQCSCPIGLDCKHVVAALMELRRSDLGLGDKREPLPQSVRQRIADAQRRRWAQLKSGEVSKALKSKLHNKLASHLGRKLGSEEAEFVQYVQTTYGMARLRPLTEGELIQMAAEDDDFAWGSIPLWRAVELWPELPSDEFRFWLFVAWELRRRNVSWPAFMDGITDLSLIEPVMEEWEQQKELKKWNQWFHEVADQLPAVDAGILELRLAIFETEARLQWRVSPDAEFGDLKQSRVKQLDEQISRGRLTVAQSSLPLWSSCYRPWQHSTWWSFPFANPYGTSTLYQLLRMNLDPERVVTADGQPLQRAAEPLRLTLRPPQDGDPKYELTLTTADGSPPPRVICALEGKPTLYLTERGLFEGPPAALMGVESRKSIPPSALETTEGVRFLHGAGIPIPERLSHRVQTVPVGVSVSCALAPTYGGRLSEEVVITVAAEAPGMPEEIFTSDGWVPATRSGVPNKRAKSDPDTILVYDRTLQRHFPRVLETLEIKRPRYSSGWTFRLTKKNVEPFVSWLKSLPSEIELLLDPELATLRDEPISGTVTLDVSETEIDWFDLKVSLHVNDVTLTQEELKLLLNARGSYVRLGNKGWRRLQLDVGQEDDEQLARLGLNVKDLSAEPQRFHALQLADPAAKKFLGPERVEKIQRRVSELKTRVAPPLPPAIRAEMRPYQTEGFHFLAYLTSNRFGGVLADDMGLGKTLQTLAWLAWARGIVPAPLSSLVVCPKSVMDNWRVEAERFYPELRVRLWRGESHKELPPARKTADLIVVNYAQLRALSPEITNVPWFAAVLDEAQYIKNPDSQTAQTARALRAEHRLALTGTPIENRLLDLWSIIGFAMPGVLGNRTQFLRRFDTKDDPLARRRLAARVRPFLLRRTKGQVARDLPDRVEEDLLCEMEGRQLTLYQAELKRARQILLGLKTNRQLNAERFTILTSLLRLRQICCHPALVDAKLRKAGSSKLDALVDLVEPLMEEGHKVLVFSQFVTMLDLIRSSIQKKGWPHFYLAGDTENRGDLVQKFQSAPEGAVFMISLRAGGFGLNLTAASYVVLFDPWWNPAVESQAIDRTHRIGQSSKVMAYRLIMRDSIEQKIRALQKQKAALAEDVLGEERFAQSLTLDDLQFLFAE